MASPDIGYEDAARNMQALHAAFTGSFKGMVEPGATVPGGGSVIDSMTIRTAIIQSAVIQGPGAQAVTGGITGGGGDTNTNVVTVMGSSSSSVSAVNQLQSSPGTSNPASPLSRRFNR